MEAGTHVIHPRKIRRLLKVCNPSAMHDRHPQIVDPLLADQIVRVPHAVEDFARGDRSSGVLANKLEASCSSAGTGSSIQKRWYGSSAFPSRAASIGVSR